MKHHASFPPPHRMDAPGRHNGENGQRDVRSCVCLLDGVWQFSNEVVSDDTELL